MGRIPRKRRISIEKARTFDVITIHAGAHDVKAGEKTIGRAWENSDGTISVALTSPPIDGQMMLVAR